MLPIILIMLILSQGHAVDYGTDFVTAFPENLAYYFPAQLFLKLKITTFLPNTLVQVIMSGSMIFNQTISSPVVTVVDVLNAEINQFGVSGKVIRITSNKNITVLSFSKRGDSTQSNVVPPTTNLGLEYLVPSPNYTQFAIQLNTYNASQFTDSTIEPMDFSYRLIIINAEAVANKITVTQQTPTGQSNDQVITLDPFTLTQLPSNNFWFKVSSTAKVAVILTNPCIDTQNCRCNLVAHQLRPTNFLETEFIIPPFDNTDKRLFVTSVGSVSLSSGSESRTVQPASIDILPFLPGLPTGSPSLTTSQVASVRVISPGLIIDLLPINMFSGCYLVHTNMLTQAKALVLVETAEKTDLHMGNNPVSSANWNDMGNVAYSWAFIGLSNCKSCVIWHPTSPIAVYVLETSASGVTFGGPAISINDEPDPNGCVVVPTEYILSNITMSWQSARAYCGSQNLVLASPNIDFTQKKMEASLKSMYVEGYAWLGLRRSLVNSAWYWNKDVSFSYANWGYNQPSSSMCVSVRMEPGGNFTWSSVRCCSSMLPLCTREMIIVSSVFDNNPQI